MKCYEYWRQKYCDFRVAGKGVEEATKSADHAFQNWIRYREEADGILRERTEEARRIVERL